MISTVTVRAPRPERPLVQVDGHLYAEGRPIGCVIDRPRVVVVHRLVAFAIEECMRWARRGGKRCA